MTMLQKTLQIINRALKDKLATDPIELQGFLGAHLQYARKVGMPAQYELEIEAALEKVINGATYQELMRPSSSA